MLGIPCLLRHPKYHQFWTTQKGADQGANAVNAGDYEQLTYDANGNVTTRRLRDGQTIGYTYDNLNRMTFMDRSNAGIDEDITYGYDLLGRLRTSQTPWGHLTYFVYDALGRRTGETTTYGPLKTSQYDAGGRRTRLTWHDGFYVDYDYDATGNVTAIRENGATSGVGVLATYGYDNLGRRTSITRGNGTVTSYGYDAVSRLASLTEDLGGSTHDMTLGFSYNPASQITSNTRSNDIYAWGGHYNVDRAYASNGLNQLTTAGSTSLGYDGRGNLTSSGNNSYAYGQLNQLVNFPGGTLYYDPLTRLDLIYHASARTALDYDGANLSTEYNYDTGAMLRRYVHGPGVDEPLVWYEGPGTSDRRWLHADERGSVIAISNSAGTTTNINSYDEHGIPASGNIGRFGYTGQAWIPELGMWYYKARIYSPTLGRFMQTDPIGYADGLNWYNYVGSDPVNGSDPTGLREFVDSADEFNGMARLGGDEWEHTYSGLVTHSYDGLGASLGDLISTGGGRIESSAIQRADNKVRRFLWKASKLSAQQQGVLKAWIDYLYPGFYSHIAARHFGYDTKYGSVFRPEFQNENSLFSLAAFAANSAPQRDTGIPGYYRYTAQYTGVVGYLQGSGASTNLITLIVRDTGRRNSVGMRILQPVTLYPGARIFP